MRTYLLALAMLALATPAPAADVVVGLGYSDFSDDDHDDGARLDLEVYSDPFASLLGADWSIGAAIALHEAGGYWVGAGPSAVWGLRSNWFIEASVMPGYYEQAGSVNDLGSDFEIRSLIGIGRKLNRRVSVSLAATHTSNAGTGSDNPGVNSVLLRTRWHF